MAKQWNILGKKNGLQGVVQAKRGYYKERYTSITVNNDTLIFEYVNTCSMSHNIMRLKNIFHFKLICLLMPVSTLQKMREQYLPKK